jgi:hypothetical protein
VTESEERVKVARKALSDAETLRVQVLIIPKFITIQSVICFPEYLISNLQQLSAFVTTLVKSSGES